MDVVVILMTSLHNIVIPGSNIYCKSVLFERLVQAQLTVNLTFAHVHVIYLRHVVGQGCVSPVMAKVVSPVMAKVKAIMNFLLPLIKGN